MTSLNFEHLRSELPMAFNLYDTNHDGYVDFTEYVSILRSMQINPTEAEQKNVRSGQSSDKIDYKTSFNLVESISRAPDSVDVQISAFRVFDRSKTGFISSSELITTLKTIGEPLGEDETSELIKKSKVNSEGLIDYKQFCYLMFEK